MDRYNVGFISFGDEDFGASRGWTEELVKKIAPLDILYRVSGICCDNVDLDLLKRLRESGCVAVHYGFESGSNDMLKVIEKRADVELNTRVASETREAGLQTVPALVVGMPGESFRTIAETTEFMKKITEKLPRPPIISINALVALPGTPVYEYARHRGFLGTTSEDEERYLLRISDRGGSSMKQLNLTDYPYFIVQSWIRCVAIAVRYNYYRKNGLPSLSMAGLARAVADMVLRRPEKRRPLQAELYSNAFIYHSRYLVSVLLVMAKNLKEDRALFMQRCRELAMWPFRKRFYTRYVSLRSFLKEYAGDSNSMPMMRMGM